MLALARAGEREGAWLRAERQLAGRGRQARAWASPPGNFHGSTLVRLRPTDPAAATLALVAGVALEDTVRTFLSSPLPGTVGERARSPSRWERVEAPTAQDGGVPSLKWPNDLLLGGAKVAGILLERVGDAVVIGIGLNLAHHPDLPGRPATSLAAAGHPIAPEPFAETLAETLARWLARWRGEGVEPVRRRWVERAHPPGTALTARLPDGNQVDGLFDGLAPDGALLLRLAGGERRVIHAGDVFLL